MFAAVGCVPDLNDLRGGESDSSLGVAGAESFGGAMSIGAGSQGGAIGNAGTGGNPNPPSGGSTAAGTAGGGTGGLGGNGGTGGLGGNGGTGGLGGSGPVCEPMGFETCNGLDDDCNGITDDHCPMVSTEFDKDLPEVGNPGGGSAFGDNCPNGWILTGLQVGMGAYLTQVSAICQEVRAEPNGLDGSYKLVLGKTMALTPHPSTTTDPVTSLTCPANEALVQVHVGLQNHGTNPAFIVTTKVWISCGKLLLDKQGDVYRGGWTDRKEQPPVTGSSADASAWFADSSVEGGLLPTRFIGSSGLWVDRMGLAEGKLLVTIN